MSKGELHGLGSHNSRSMDLESEASFRHPANEKKLTDAVRIEMAHSFSLVLDKNNNQCLGDGEQGAMAMGSTQSGAHVARLCLQLLLHGASRARAS